MKVKPARPGLVVRDPHTKRALPPEGADVADGDSYWTRRIMDGDVVRVEDEPAAAPADDEE